MKNLFVYPKGILTRSAVTDNSIVKYKLKMVQIHGKINNPWTVISWAHFLDFISFKTPSVNNGEYAMKVTSALCYNEI